MPNKELKKEDYWRIAEEITEKIKKWPEWKRNISLLDEEDVEKSTKESKPMSETIEDRARDALNTIKHVTQWLKTRADLSVDTDYGWRANYNALKSTHKVLDDLMTEREKMKGLREDRYEFLVNEWNEQLIQTINDKGCPAKIVLTRRKPRKTTEGINEK